MNNPIETVNSFLAEFSKGANAMPAALALLTDDFHFDGPMVKARSKAEFARALQAMGGSAPTFNVLKQVASGSEVFSLYEFCAGGPTVLMAEWSRVEGGKIAEQRLVFDPAQLKPAS